MDESQARADHFAVNIAARTGLSPERTKQFALESNIDLGWINERRSRSDLLERHERGRSFTMGPDTFTLNFGMHETKPAAEFPITPDLSACTPIYVSSLKAGNTYRGRLLRGTLVVQPFVMEGVQTLLEDEKGDLVSVSIYNALPAGIPQDLQSKWAAAQRTFAQGRRLAILEPFYKLAGDGSHVVRVDNPREVVWLDAADPTDADSWRAEGGCYYC